MLLFIRVFNFIHFFAYSGQDTSTSTGSALGVLLFLILFAVSYIFSSYYFYSIYRKLGVKNAWFAWVPILSNWIMFKAGGQSPWWVIGLFIPTVNIVACIFMIIAFVNVVQRLGKNPWMILLMIIPLINLIILHNFAFG